MDIDPPEKVRDQIDEGVLEVPQIASLYIFPSLLLAPLNPARGRGALKALEVRSW